MVEIIRAAHKIECEEVLGRYLDSNYYDRVIDFDCDAYGPSVSNINDETNILFKFRKNVFSLEDQISAYEALAPAAISTQNRGLAAGPRGLTVGKRDFATTYNLEVLRFLAKDPVPTLDAEDEVTLEQVIAKYKGKNDENKRGLIWLRHAVEKYEGQYDNFFERWLEKIKPLSRKEQQDYAKKILDEYISDTNYANDVLSGIAGYFDRYPRFPYGRATSYTEKNAELFKKSFPFLKSLDDQFKKHLPIRYAAQKTAAKNTDKKFLVGDTVFTTITVNKNFRTAAHRDAGDLNSGFSNLSVLTNGKTDYQGAYLVLPEFRLAINIRPGDLLLINNHECIHGNTELIGDENMERISIVCYFREKMLDLGSWEYENLRRQYVTERKNNTKHPLWKPLWNGVSPDMWEQDEWRDYLIKHGMIKEAEEVRATSLESYFE